MSNIIDHISGLLSQLQSPDFYEREEAVRQLGTFTEDEAVAGLVMAIEDPDLGIRELAADLLSQMKGDIASQLLIRFLGHNDIGARNLAAEVLVRIGNATVGPLTAEIENDDHDVRKFIVDVLGLIGDPAAVDAICGRLHDENPNVICSAAEALGKIGSVEAVEPLLDAYDRVEDARLPALEALGKIGDRSALDRLYGFLKTMDPMITFAAIEAIGQIGDQQAVPKLMEYLECPDSSIAEAALVAIIDISLANNGRLDYDLPLDRFTDFLFDAIRNRNKKITEFTLGRLSHWYGNKVVSSLIDVLDSVDDTERKRIADVLEDAGPSATRTILDKFASASAITKTTLLEVVRQFADEDIGAGLIPYADDPDPEVRQRIAHVLGISGYLEAVPKLKQLAHDQVGHVRGAAFAALGWLCDESDIDFLMKGLDDPYGDVREAAMGAMIIVGGRRVIDKFTEDLFHDSIERQRLATTALGLIGDADVVEPLFKAVGHPEPTIRKQALNSLSRIRGVEDVDLIIPALSDESSSVRKAAITAIATLKGPNAVRDVRFLLDDEDVWVRYHTINTIGDFGQAEYSDVILPYLDDENDVIKIAAVKALAQMQSRASLPHLRRLRNDRNQDVVEAVDLAVGNLEADS